MSAFLHLSPVPWLFMRLSDIPAHPAATPVQLCAPVYCSGQVSALSTRVSLDHGVNVVAQPGCVSLLPSLC